MTLPKTVLCKPYMEISMLNTTFTGNITFAEIVEQDAKVENPFLKIVVAVNDVNDNGLRITVRTKNGLLEAARNGENLVGTRVVINGTIDIASIRSHYVDENGDLVALKQPNARVYANAIERMNRKPEPATVQTELAVK
jgi:hypothetical protein|tara:strand:- start:463 stop:879 length:417 start_codon:yes stop_codon:yes gene_type:complete